MLLEMTVWQRLGGVRNRKNKVKQKEARNNLVNVMEENHV